MQENVSSSRSKMTPFLQTLIQAWRLYVRGFVSFIGMYLWGLLGLLPVLVLALLALLVFMVLSWHFFVLYVLFALLGLASFAWAIYYGTRAKIGLILLLKNDFKSVKADFKESKKYFWRFLWASLLVSLITIVLSLFLIIPGIVVGVSYAFTLFAVVLADKRTFSSIEKSYDLVKKYWWPVFGRFLLLGLIAFVLVLVMNIPMSYLNDMGKQVYSTFFNLVWAILTPYFLVYTYFMYQDLVSKQ
ncbi:hypothetical protein JXE04_03240 [Patescibacteria group bacterium]|nr:hypothetical protein [Patescibacteria group bacterium]